jgi:hypothetical protein
MIHAFAETRSAAGLTATKTELATALPQASAD